MAEADVAQEAFQTVSDAAQVGTQNMDDDSNSQIESINHAIKSNETYDFSCAHDERTADEPETPPLSKNQLKKLKRKQQWEEGRDARKARRREKNKARRDRKRAAEKELEEDSPAEFDEINEPISNDKTVGQSLHGDSRSVGAHGVHFSSSSNVKGQKKRHIAISLPLTFIYDCNFDDLMTDGERISLASQLTRCYSYTRKAKYRVNMVISSFGGKLKERFEGILDRHHEQWKGVKFTADDFATAAQLAAAGMREMKLQPDIPSAKDAPSQESKGESATDTSGTSTRPTCASDASLLKSLFCEGADQPPEVIYLTSDSPNSLEFLRPYSTYIIGGIVDKNRHKGICYKRACDAGIKTAKLPIGEYMRMSSRQVLTTNHVSEIMLKLLECGGDWGEAFDTVIPKRKGGVLKERLCNDENATDEHGAHFETDRATEEATHVSTSSSGIGEPGDFDPSSPDTNVDTGHAV